MRKGGLGVNGTVAVSLKSGFSDIYIIYFTFEKHPEKIWPVIFTEILKSQTNLHVVGLDKGNIQKIIFVATTLASRSNIGIVVGIAVNNVKSVQSAPFFKYQGF